MTSKGHALVLTTGTSKFFSMFGALEEERYRRRKLWDNQYVDDMFEFAGNHLESP